MTDKCYRVEFTAHLHKLTLALKMSCQIEVIWKRGEKVCESGKVALSEGVANFDRKITISCNMIFNPLTKIFKEKITKFSIILISQKGTKQAGEIEFDVAEYINEKQLDKKFYEQKLSGCPDKNAKLTFTLTGVLKEQVGMDARSLSSYVNTDNNVLDQNNSNISSFSKTKGQTQNSQQTPTQDKARIQGKSDGIKKLQQQNKRIKQQLKAAEKLKKQNQQLRKKIKAQDYGKAAQIKQKIQKRKKQIQAMKAQIRANKKIQDETAQLQKDILHCKIKMMKAFNYAAEFGGSSLVDKIQDYCGIMEK